MSVTETNNPRTEEMTMTKYTTDMSRDELAAASKINNELVDTIPPGEEAVFVRLDSANGPKALYLGSLSIEEVLAALPAGWTVHESDWSNAVQIDDLTWSVPLTKVEEPTRTRIILDNGGGLVLQLGDWAHSYEGSAASAIATQAAIDIREWLKTGTTKGWEGHEAEALAVAPTADEIRNGGYRVITIDRDTDTDESLAAECRDVPGNMAAVLAAALQPVDPPRAPKTTWIEIKQSEVPKGVIFGTLPQDQGQAIEVSYAYSGQDLDARNAPFKKVVDRSVGPAARYYRAVRT